MPGRVINGGAPVKKATRRRTLTSQHMTFIHSYLSCQDYQKAAIAAGVDPARAASQGNVWMKWPEVQLAIAIEQRRALNAAQITAKEVVGQLGHIMRSDIRAVIRRTKEGDGMTLKDIAELDDATAAAIASIEFLQPVEERVVDSRGRVTTVPCQRVKVRFWSKPAAANTLLQWFDSTNPKMPADNRPLVAFHFHGIERSPLPAKPALQVSGPARAMLPTDTQGVEIVNPPPRQRRAIKTDDD